jgi:hypothetical protein
MSPHRIGLVAAAAALLFGAACGGEYLAGPGGARIARSGAIGSIEPLVGTWRRAVFFVDDFGISRATETTWRFAADGSASRTLVTRNLTLGVADVYLAAGRWRTAGNQLVIDLDTPSPAQLQFTTRVVGDQLELSGELYLRATG